MSCSVASTREHGRRLSMGFRFVGPKTCQAVHYGGQGARVLFAFVDSFFRVSRASLKTQGCPARVVFVWSQVIRMSLSLAVGAKKSCLGSVV